MNDIVTSKLEEQVQDNLKNSAKTNTEGFWDMITFKNIIRVEDHQP